MKKVYFLAFFWAILMILPVFADVKFKDVPADHWAAKSVYDLVKMGVTQGYPDGTFRGNKNITRYETAIFLSKLSEQFGGENSAKIQSDLDDIKTEISKLKSSGTASISGEYIMTSRLANVFANSGNVTSRGPFMGYRLKTTLSPDLGKSAGLKINFDTMDAGFYGATRDVFTQMIDVQGSVKINPVDIGISDFGFSSPLNLNLFMGPGPIQHTDETGMIPSENGYTFERPYSGISLDTDFSGLGVSAGYYQIVKTFSGKSETSLLKAGIKYTFLGIPLLNDINLEAVGDYYFKHPTTSGKKDLRAVVNMDSHLSEKALLKTTLGAGSSSFDGFLVGAEINYGDFITSGTNLKFYGKRVGANYICPDFASEQFNVAGYDMFMRPLLSDTMNIGGELLQNVTDKFSILGKGSLRLGNDFGYGKNIPKSLATAQLSLLYMIAPQAMLDTYYRVEQDPVQQETTDLAAMGLMYRF